MIVLFRRPARTSGPRETRRSFGLDRGRERRDLVEEERPAVRELELSRPRRDGAREGPLSRGRRAPTPRAPSGSAEPFTATKGRRSAGSPGESPRPRAPCPSRSRPAGAPSRRTARPERSSRRAPASGRSTRRGRRTNGGSGSRSSGSGSPRGGAPARAHGGERRGDRPSRRAFEEVERAEIDGPESVPAIRLARHDDDRGLGALRPDRGEEREPLLRFVGRGQAQVDEEEIRLPRGERGSRRRVAAVTISKEPLRAKTSWSSRRWSSSTIARRPSLPAQEASSTAGSRARGSPRPGGSSRRGRPGGRAGSGCSCKGRARLRPASSSGKAGRGGRA